MSCLKEPTACLPGALSAVEAKSHGILPCFHKLIKWGVSAVQEKGGSFAWLPPLVALS